MTEKIKKLIEDGVIFKDANNCMIDDEVTIGSGTVIYPGVVIEGRTSIGRDCVLRPGCYLRESSIGERCDLLYVVSERASVDDDVKIGPFVNLRPDTHVSAQCRIGDFVEIKNSSVGEATKVSHLTYIGDADVGARVNVGCGCVFVNYDGFEKHRSTVGDDVFLGCQTKLVSPVKVGDDACTAAGSTITEDVPAGALAIARSKQSNHPGWVEKYRAFKSAKRKAAQDAVSKKNN